MTLAPVLPHPSAVPRALAIAVLLLAAVGCGRGASPAPARGDGGSDAAAPRGPAPRQDAAPRRMPPAPVEPEPGRPEPEVPTHAAGDMVRVEAGPVLAGSEPGSPGRVPEAEMDGEEVALSAFEIDALPYPNDPAAQPLVGVDRERAAALCAEAGKRLCHELEWERTCEGPDGRLYPYGDAFDAARYEAPLGLASPSGALAMGVIAEWTASPWGEPIDGRRGGAVVRGPTGGGGTAASRRCAARSGLLPATEEPWLGFRCCRGEEQGEAAAYRTAEPAFPFNRQEDLGPAEAFQRVVRSVPELREVQDDPQPFSQEDVFNLMGEAGLAGPNAVAGTWYTWLPVLWTPRQGEEILVLAGADGVDTFVAALYVLPGGRYRYAASYVFLGTTRAIILSYTRDRRQVLWNPCIDCRDGGLVTYEDGRVAITQRW